MRLIASDLDGTLLRSDGSVSRRTRDALAVLEESGRVLVLVTGRPPRWMAPVVEATGHRGLALCANGAVVYDLATESVVQEDLIDPAVGAEVVAAIREALPDVVFAVERSRARGLGRESAYALTYDPVGGVLVGEVDELLADPVAKLLARHPDLGPDEMLARVREVVGDLCEVTHSSDHGLMEISATGVSKAFALARLAEELGFGAEDVVAVGDMPNDLPMLAWAGRAVAVANAHP
ncbi:MAG: HAD family hydrolase, partial [Acidimicrobiia bacterium]|nr:HAD family hydrolase [Acidimicrobiia bacterium]